MGGLYHTFGGHRGKPDALDVGCFKRDRKISDVGHPRRIEEVGGMSIAPPIASVWSQNRIDVVGYTRSKL